MEVYGLHMTALNFNGSLRTDVGYLEGNFMNTSILCIERQQCIARNLLIG